MQGRVVQNSGHQVRTFKSVHRKPFELCANYEPHLFITKPCLYDANETKLAETGSNSSTSNIKSVENESNLTFSSDFSPNPGVNFLNLNNRPDLGLEYYPKANILSDQQNYAVIVANRITKNSAITYFFNIPIACMAWRQIGYGCFIVIPWYKKDNETEKAVNIVKEHTLKWGNEHLPGSVIILDRLANIISN